MRRVRFTLSEPVCAGVRFLDERVPGWWNMIDTDTLDLASCDLCVLAQVYIAQHGHPDDLGSWLSPFGRMKEEFGLDAPAIAASGFISEADGWADNVIDSAALTAEWREAIEAKRAAE
jgi:hypothetical protein